MLGLTIRLKLLCLINKDNRLTDTLTNNQRLEDNFHDTGAKLALLNQEMERLKEELTLNIKDNHTSNELITRLRVEAEHLENKLHNIQKDNSNLTKELTITKIAQEQIINRINKKHQDEINRSNIQVKQLQTSLDDLAKDKHTSFIFY